MAELTQGTSQPNLETLSMQASEQIETVTGLLEILDNVRDVQGFGNEEGFCDRHLSALIYAMTFISKAASGSIAELRTHIHAFSEFE